MHFTIFRRWKPMVMASVSKFEIIFNYCARREESLCYTKGRSFISCWTWSTTHPWGTWMMLRIIFWLLTDSLTHIWWGTFLSVNFQCEIASFKCGGCNLLRSSTTSFSRRKYRETYTEELRIWLLLLATMDMIMKLSKTTSRVQDYGTEKLEICIILVWMSLIHPTPITLMSSKVIVFGARDVSRMKENLLHIRRNVKSSRNSGSRKNDLYSLNDFKSDILYVFMYFRNIIDISEPMNLVFIVYILAPAVSD